MKLANYEREGKLYAGVVNEGIVYDVSSFGEESGLSSIESVDQLLAGDILDLLRRVEPNLTSSRGVSLESVRLRSRFSTRRRSSC